MRNYKNHILTLSVISLLIVLAHINYQVATLQFPEFYTSADKIYEYLAVSLHLVVMLPAIIGLLNAKKIKTRWLFIAYVVYTLLCIINYSSSFWSSDPITNGLFLIGLLLPFSLILSLILVIKFKSLK